MTPLPRLALPLAWEGGADDGDGAPPAAAQERSRLERIAHRLRDRYPRGGERNDWVKKVHDARLMDLVVFNFDLTLAEADGEELPGGAERRPDRVNEGATRVWYPHGHVDDPAEIVLGTRRYGLEITRLEKARNEFWGRWRKRNEGQSEPSDVEPEHWLDLLLSNRPLFMIGLGLSPDEWTIWWALTQRARRFLRRPESQRPATVAFVLDEGRELDERREWLSVATKALGVELVRFSRADASQVWKSVLASVGEARPDSREGA
jgi:hypothetical protein